MSKAIPQGEVIKAALSAVEEAQRLYERTSGGLWLWEAPEYLVTTTIAKKLYELTGAKYVTMESGVRETLYLGGAWGQGRPKQSLRSNGRFDVTLWWGNGNPRAAIEVKNDVSSYSQLSSDVARLGAVVTKNVGSATIQFAMMVFYSSAMRKDQEKNGPQRSAETRLKHIIDSIFVEAKESVPNGVIVELHQSEIHAVASANRSDAWAATCLVLKAA